jgi:hypothetical protein
MPTGEAGYVHPAVRCGRGEIATRLPAYCGPTLRYPETNYRVPYMDYHPSTDRSFALLRTTCPELCDVFKASEELFGVVAYMHILSDVVQLLAADAELSQRPGASGEPLLQRFYCWAESAIGSSDELHEIVYHGCIGSLRHVAGPHDAFIRCMGPRLLAAYEEEYPPF